jgi:hypothetical protein
MKFGELLSKIEKKMVDSYVNESIKEDLKTFKNLVLNNKGLSSMYSIYNQLSKKQGLDKETGELFIKESVRQLERIIPNLETKQVSEWVSNVVCENQYSNIDKLVYVGANTILESVEGRKSILNTITSSETIKESINLPIETIFGIANKQVEKFISEMDETSKSDLAKVLMTEDVELSKEFDTLRSKTIETLSSLNESDEDTKKKLQETIQQIEQEEYSKINYVRLFNLYNNLV